MEQQPPEVHIEVDIMMLQWAEVQQMDLIIMLAWEEVHMEMEVQEVHLIMLV